MKRTSRGKPYIVKARAAMLRLDRTCLRRLPRPAARCRSTCWPVHVGHCLDLSSAPGDACNSSLRWVGAW